jgi:hypothetical protein
MMAAVSAAMPQEMAVLYYRAVCKFQESGESRQCEGYPVQIASRARMRMCSRAANSAIREPQCYRLLDYILRSGCLGREDGHEVFSACIAMEELGIALRCDGWRCAARLFRVNMLLGAVHRCY